MYNGNLSNTIDRIFGDIFFNAWYDNGEFAVDILDGKDGIKITAELPGIKKEDLNIEYDKYILTISAEKQENKIDENECFIKKEIRSGSVLRSFSVGVIDYEKIIAKFKNGILTINIPKDDVSKKIDIK